MKKQAEAILGLAKKNNGTVTSAMVTEANLARGSLKYLADTGKLIKVERGAYLLPEGWEDDYYDCQNRYKRGIFSHTSALFLWDLENTMPDFFTMTFPATYNVNAAQNAGLRCIRAKEPFYSMGVTTIKTIVGHEVRCYDAERSICDMLRYPKRFDFQTGVRALQAYAHWPNRNADKLRRYADALRVRKVIEPFIALLL